VLILIKHFKNFFETSIFLNLTLCDCYSAQEQSILKGPAILPSHLVIYPEPVARFQIWQNYTSWSKFGSNSIIFGCLR